ncbi:uncharacterized protein A4U43_C07F35140 [Asparagus officinalis]|uniref:Uncharacterized protein n=1 Tax=Asparagus officinalis TaxID=4686 RepID=A0A5P1EHN2_ASPOF|nr:uncharacterized protein A4U43_C07F35140 [Asparagus officinalis]
MGCHSSKQAQRDLLRSPSPLPRSKSLPDNGHVVSLTSSTLGSLNLNEDVNGEKASIDLEKVRSWSEAIGRKIPRTPTETPPNEPEPINGSSSWPGFHGDCSPLDRRSFSFCPTGRVSTGAGDPDARFDESEEQCGGLLLYEPQGGKEDL